MLREVISEYNLAPEDLLFKMKKKLSDDPLNYN